MSSYPLSLNLAGKRVVVVGAGTVASRRVPSLIAAGARVLVIAPSASESIQQLGQQHSVELQVR